MLIVGFGILAVAILVNFLAKILGLETWYSFIENLQKNGFSDILKTKGVHSFFLFIIYPLILGLAAYFFVKILN
jgi:hypothetical protein